MKFSRNLFASQTRLLEDGRVEVLYRFRDIHGQKVYVTFPSGVANNPEFNSEAAAELFVLREVLMRGSIKMKDRNKIPFRFATNIRVALSNKASVDAIRHTIRDRADLCENVKGYAYFAFFWLRDVEIIEGEDNKELQSKLVFLEKFGKVNRRAFEDVGNLLDTKIHGLIKVTHHAMRKCIAFSAFAQNKLTAEKVPQYISTDLNHSIQCQVGLTGKVAEDKVFYSQEAEQWGSPNRYIRYTIVNDKFNKNMKVMLTAYQRPFKVGEDPNEVVLLSYTDTNAQVA